MSLVEGDGEKYRLMIKSGGSGMFRAAQTGALHQACSGHLSDVYNEDVRSSKPHEYHWTAEGVSRRL